MSSGLGSHTPYAPHVVSVVPAGDEPSLHSSAAVSPNFGVVMDGAARPAYSEITLPGTIPTPRAWSGATMAGHGDKMLHSVAPSGALRPTGHGMLAVAPVFGLKLPALQAAQSASAVRAAEVFEKRPGEHRLPQSAERPVVLLHFPREHRSAHGAVAPSSALHVPSAHR